MSFDYIRRRVMLGEKIVTNIGELEPENVIEGW